MQLLDPIKLKEDKKNADLKNQQYVNDLNKEITRLTTSLNDLRLKFRVEEQETLEKTQKMQKDFDLEKARLESQIARLEEKRDRFMKSLEPLREELEERIAQVEVEAKKLEKQSDRLQRYEDRLSQREERIERKNDEVKEIQESAKQMQREIKSERRSAISQHRQAERAKLRIEKQVVRNEELNEQLVTQLAELERKTKSLDDYAESLEKKNADLISFEKRLKSEREAIKQAKIHLGIV